MKSKDESFFSGDVVGLATDVPLFNKEKHVSYWLRCLRTPLPQAYTSNDANRMTLTFFILSSLDLLGVLFTRTSPAERREYADWIYNHQHPRGGFRGFSGTDFGNLRNPKNQIWDPATLSATYFALASLSVLADDLRRVERVKCLTWLQGMQRPDGSFGDFLGPGGHVEGGMDTRFGYFAASIRWWLRRSKRGLDADIPDFDVEKLVRCISESEAFDGGISEMPFHEAHSGFTYCAIATLACIDHSVPAAESAGPFADTAKRRDKSALNVGLSSREHTVKWLTSRLTTVIEEDEFDDDNASDTSSTAVREDEHTQDPTCLSATNTDDGFHKMRSTPMELRNGVPQIPDISEAERPINKSMLPVHWTGFNGRANKVADTCYAFWVGASLKILDAIDLVDLEHVRCYLLEKTQHMVAGGFGKMPGDLPDIYHAYLGLAALAVINGHKEDGATIGPDMEDASRKVTGWQTKTEAGTRRGDTDRTIRALDPVLCISLGARRWVESLEWRNRGDDVH